MRSRGMDASESNSYVYPDCIEMKKYHQTNIPSNTYHISCDGWSSGEVFNCLSLAGRELSSYKICLNGYIHAVTCYYKYKHHCNSGSLDCHAYLKRSLWASPYS